MNTIVVDAGPLFAAFSRKDRHYPAALRFIRMTGVRLFTNIPVITEVAPMLGKAPTTRLEFLKWSDGALDIDEATATDLPRIVALLEKYQDMRPDFTDASLIALCERIGTHRIATVDRDFQVYRTRSKKPFDDVFDED